MLMHILILLILGISSVSAESLWPDLSRPISNVGGGEKDAAVVVGAGDYLAVDHVPGAADNAVAWQAYFTESRKIPAEKVTLLRDGEATLEKMRRFVKRAVSEVSPGGTLWFVFIGHGSHSKDGDGLLVGVDVQPDLYSLNERSLSRAELLDIISKGRQGRAVLLLDACFSGRSASGQDLVKGLQPLAIVRDRPRSLDDRTIILSAAKSDEFAGPLPHADRLRPGFSYLALGALRGWAADAQGNVKAASIVEFARRALRMEHGRTQTPELSAGDGEAVLGRGSETAPDLSKIDREGGYPAPAPNVPKPTAGKVGIQWVRIPGGTFAMGTGEGNESPVRKVTVKTFQIAKTPVTNKQYKACVDAGACTPPATHCIATPNELSDEQPVVCVNWIQARDFSKWVGGRLPSESEWEYAGRSAGKDWMCPYRKIESNCKDSIVPGCFGAAPIVCSSADSNTDQGLCDMAGDVREWVQDSSHGSYDGLPEDGTAWEDPGADELISNRIFRGGFRDRSTHNSCKTIRGHNVASYTSASTGFRPVR